MDRRAERDRVVGRERELAAIERLLARGEEGLHALEFEGEPESGRRRTLHCPLSA